MTTNTEEVILTEQDTRMLWALQKGTLPDLTNSNTVRILDVYVDYNRLNQVLEDEILQVRRNWIRLTSEDGKLLVQNDYEAKVLGIDKEVIYAHARAMGRRNTWANQRWRDRSDNFFGEGFISPDYQITPYVDPKSEKDRQFVIEKDMIVPAQLAVVISEEVARGFFSDRMRKASESVSQLEGRVKSIIGRDVLAQELPFNGYEINGKWDSGYKTSPSFSPLWAHNLKVEQNRTITASLYLEDGYGGENVYHIKEHDERRGVFGKLTFSPLLTNGQPADAEALGRYLSILRGSK